MGRLRKPCENEDRPGWLVRSAAFRRPRVRDASVPSKGDIANEAFGSQSRLGRQEPLARARSPEPGRESEKEFERMQQKRSLR